MINRYPATIIPLHNAKYTYAYNIKVNYKLECDKNMKEKKSLFNNLRNFRFNCNGN